MTRLLCKPPSIRRESAVPYTVLISPEGKVLYQRGLVDMLELRRTILANLPSDYEGFNQYWAAR